MSFHKNCAAACRRDGSQVPPPAAAGRARSCRPRRAPDSLPRLLVDAPRRAPCEGGCRGAGRPGPRSRRAPRQVLHPARLVHAHAASHAFGCARQRGGSAPDALVDTCFREQFALAKATPKYDALLALLPDVFVGDQQRLQAVVVGAAVEATCHAQGLSLPPWRTTQALMTKWRPAHYTDALCVNAGGGAAGSASGASVGRVDQQAAAAVLAAVPMDDSVLLPVTRCSS